MIGIFLPMLLASGVQQPPVPRRVVPDSGVVVNAQQVTPAGVQSVFEGRVAGVRFGTSDDDIWVAVPGSVYHLAWRDNRVLSSSTYDGHAGVQGVAIDPATGRAVVSTVGRGTTNPEGELPGGITRLARSEAVRLAFFDGSGSSAVRAAFASGAVGDYAAGAPAVAHTPNATGHRVAVLPLTANDRLAVVDADRGTVLKSIEVGVAPIAAVVSTDGRVAWVTNLGGAKPGPHDRSASECCHQRAERVRVDARGIAEPGSVMRVDLVTGRVTSSIIVGRHPTALAWDMAHGILYVADGNDESISVIDSRQSRITRRIDIGGGLGGRIGAEPTAVAVSPDGRSLYVALGALNAVAVYDAARGEILGAIPTGWYPSSLDVSPDGHYLAVGALFGVGSGTGETDGSPGRRGRYVFAERGSVNIVELPSAAQLDAYTRAVAVNDRLPRTFNAGVAVADSGLPGPIPTAMAVPSRPGIDTSLIKHVVYIVKENRTYDQILGDLGRGDGDSSLVIFGREVTPNQHALAEQFVTIDRMFASGGNSADGHQWLTQANETDYAMWPLYLGRSYPSEGNDPLTYSSGGFLWEAAQARGKTVAVFGEYAPAASDSIASVRANWHREFAANRGRGSAYFRDLMAKRYDTHSEIPSLDSVLVREYPGWTQEVPDVVKAQVILAHLSEWERRGVMPDLVMIVLPSDHTVGTTPGWCTPRACVADNDAALGMLVDGFSHSPFWRDMAILVVEDDAQNGVDHVDGHRTTAFVASPYARRGVVDHTFYNQPSMVKTIELMLGLSPMSLFDLVATSMSASFVSGPSESPNFAPFTALAPRLSLDETNPRVSEIRGRNAASRRRAARASARMQFDGPDEAPSDALNRILWHEARGWRASYPPVRHSLFFPMSRDIADEAREERATPRR